MELEQRREIEYLKRDLQMLDQDERDLLQQLETVRAKKGKLLEKIAGMSDEKYEQDVLEQLYRQKHNIK